MMFWCQGAGLDFDYALKLVPWYERARGGSSMLMLDSGVRQDPPDVAELAKIQIERADVAVCPDILGDPVATADRTETWLRLMEPYPQIIRVLCTQGEIEERIDLMRRFAGRVQWAGAGLACKSPGVRWTDEEREDVLCACVPEAHRLGMRFHAFGIGCTLRQLTTMHALGVDSFDSSTPVLIAQFGKVLDEGLNQIQIGGTIDQSYKRLLVGISLRSVTDQVERLGADCARGSGVGLEGRRGSTARVAQMRLPFAV